MWENNETFAGGYGATDSNAGGFMNTSTNFGTPGGSAKKQGMRKNQNIVAVTIRSVLNMQGEGVQIADTPVHMVVICGIVRGVEESSSKTVYTIDDHTGVIDVTQFHEEEDAAGMGGVAEGLYARVHGTVRNSGGNITVLSFKIQQVEDPNMITTHILEVIHHRMKLQQILTKKEGGASTGGAQPVLANSSLQQRGAGGSAAELVCDAIRSFGSANGVNKQMMRQALAGKLAAATIDETVEQLLGDGMIYSTTDEDHFLVIDQP